MPRPGPRRRLAGPCVESHPRTGWRNGATTTSRIAAVGMVHVATSVAARVARVAARQWWNHPRGNPGRLPWVSLAVPWVSLAVGWTPLGPSVSRHGAITMSTLHAGAPRLLPIPRGLWTETLREVEASSLRPKCTNGNLFG